MWKYEYGYLYLTYAYGDKSAWYMYAIDDEINELLECYYGYLPIYVVCDDIE